MQEDIAGSKIEFISALINFKDNLSTFSNVNLATIFKHLNKYQFIVKWDFERDWVICYVSHISGYSQETRLYNNMIECLSQDSINNLKIHCLMNALGLKMKDEYVSDSSNPATGTLRVHGDNVDRATTK